MRWLLVLCVACGGSLKLPVTPQLELTAPGAAPREVIRFAATAGTSERAEITLKLRSRTTFENTVLEQGRQDVDFPAVRVRGPMTVTAASPDGDAAITFVVEESELLDDVVDPAMRPAFAARTEALRGITTSWRRAPTGAITPIASSSKDEWKDIAEGLAATAIRFPEGPIGIGATWRISSTFHSGEVRGLRVVTYHLRDRDGDSVTIDAETELQAGDQALSTEPNATRHLRSARGRGTFHGVVPLRGVIADAQAHDSLALDVLITQRRLRVQSTVTIETIFATARR